VKTKDTATKDASIAVLEIVQLLKHVASEDHERVLRTVATFLKVDLPPPVGKKFSPNSMSPGSR
jgi:hypothetical protein